MSSDAVEYEVLPQRQPRAKRKQMEPQEDPVEASADVNDETEGVENAQQGAASDQSGDGGEPAAEAEQNNNGENDKEGQELEHHTVEAYRAGAEEGYNFEYLDHTADVQLHAWGKTLQEAFENVGLAMMNYMTPLSGINTKTTNDDNNAETKTYEAEGHDLQSLLYHYLDELLFGFSTDFFVPGKIEITTFDRENWKIVAVGTGEVFDRNRHACGTEIQAITYSAMQINENEEDADVFVIVDI